jgi:hypothetical protein
LKPALLLVLHSFPFEKSGLVETQIRALPVIPRPLSGHLV